MAMEPPEKPSGVELAAGNPQAFAALYDRLGERLYRLARSMLASPTDAEDAVQDLFVDLVRSRHVLGSAADLEAYVFTAFRRLLVRRRARHQRRQWVLAVMPRRLGGETGQAVEIDEVDHLRQVLRELPPPQREVISLKVDADLTFAQIGAVLDVSPNTAASRYRYALQKLRERLARGGDES